MTKKEIVDKLGIYGVKRNSGQASYQRAKEIIFQDMPSHKEYESRLGVIISYLKI